MKNPPGVGKNEKVTLEFGTGVPVPVVQLNVELCASVGSVNAIGAICIGQEYIICQ